MSETKPPPSANQAGPGSPTADGRLWYTDTPGSVPAGYYIDPDPNQAAKDAAARAEHDESVSDMTPGNWSETHLIAAAYTSSPALQGDALLNGTEALCEATGEPYDPKGAMPPKAAKAMSDVYTSKMTSAVTQVRNGETVTDAFKGQMKGQGGNVSNPNFTREELATASAYPSSWGAPNK